MESDEEHHQGRLEDNVSQPNEANFGTSLVNIDTLVNVNRKQMKKRHEGFIIFS